MASRRCRLRVNRSGGQRVTRKPNLMTPNISAVSPQTSWPCEEIGGRWRATSGPMRLRSGEKWLGSPRRKLLFDVEQNYLWPPEWGNRPVSSSAREEIFARSSPAHLWRTNLNESFLGSTIKHGAHRPSAFHFGLSLKELGAPKSHGPRADQTGRIHISDFRNPRTFSLAKRSRSIHSGQSRPSEPICLPADVRSAPKAT
jgi:hypothetical protein